MSRFQNRARLTQALDLVTLAADDYQLDLQSRIAGGLGKGIIGPIGIGATLALGRDIDTLERIQRELVALLDSRPLRPVPSASVAHPTAA
jgi:hypothetical protein